MTASGTEQGAGRVRWSLMRTKQGGFVTGVAPGSPSRIVPELTTISPPSAPKRASVLLPQFVRPGFQSQHDFCQEVVYYYYLAVSESLDSWHESVDRSQWQHTTLNFVDATDRSRQSWGPKEIEWSVDTSCFEVTEPDHGHTFNPLSERTSRFVLARGLRESVEWLRTEAPKFFPDACFEMDLQRGEDEEDDLLALTVHSSFDPMDFRKRRHQLSDAMEVDHNGLHEVLGVFQRRVHRSGRQTFPFYSKIPPE
ncbi:MAG: hypothetical protein HQ592_03475 [Planctomycetes bacterium]|nr:hypothetical protein [Planctomycetota bacterium]